MERLHGYLWDAKWISIYGLFQKILCQAHFKWVGLTQNRETMTCHYLISLDLL